MPHKPVSLSEKRSANITNPLERIKTSLEFHRKVCRSVEAFRFRNTEDNREYFLKTWGKLPDQPIPFKDEHEALSVLDDSYRDLRAVYEAYHEAKADSTRSLQSRFMIDEKLPMLGFLYEGYLKYREGLVISMRMTHQYGTLIYNEVPKCE